MLKATRTARRFSITSRKDFKCIFSDLDEHGYLPNVKPLTTLPPEFSLVDQIL